MQQLRFLPGKPLPLGASVQNGGVNFSVFTRNGAGVFLEFFENPKDASPFESYRFDPRLNRTGDIWHVFVEGLGPEALYLYRVDGPFRPSEGLRFNVNKYLLDPYAKAMTAESIFLGQEIHRKRTASLDPDLAFSTTDTAEHFPKCIV